MSWRNPGPTSCLNCPLFNSQKVSAKLQQQAQMFWSPLRQGADCRPDRYLHIQWWVPMKKGARNSEKRARNDRELY
jgi:hypothetical protein